MDSFLFEIQSINIVLEWNQGKTFPCSPYGSIIPLISWVGNTGSFQLKVSISVIYCYNLTPTHWMNADTHFHTQARMLSLPHKRPFPCQASLLSALWGRRRPVYWCKLAGGQPVQEQRVWKSSWVVGSLVCPPLVPPHRTPKRRNAITWWKGLGQATGLDGPWCYWNYTAWPCVHYFLIRMYTMLHCGSFAYPHSHGIHLFSYFHSCISP